MNTSPTFPIANVTSMHLLKLWRFKYLCYTAGKWMSLVNVIWCLHTVLSPRTHTVFRVRFVYGTWIISKGSVQGQWYTCPTVCHTVWHLSPSMSCVNRLTSQVIRVDVKQWDNCQTHVSGSEFSSLVQKGSEMGWSLLFVCHIRCGTQMWHTVVIRTQRFKVVWSH